jgi:voltage-gated potassium channel
MTSVSAPDRSDEEAPEPDDPGPAPLVTLQRWRRSGMYARFVDRSEEPMLVLAVIFVVVLVLPLVNRNLGPTTRAVLHWADLTIWAIFVVEYVSRLALAPDRWRFVRNHLPDLAIVVIPPLRGLRVVVALIRLLGLVSMVGRLSRQSLHVRTGTYTGILAVGVLFAGAVTVLDVERGASDANIKTFPDALWWSLTTMTTVGYGDRFPVTTEGRLLAAGLMLAGIAVLGVVTASIAAWFIGQFSAVTESVDAAAESVEEAAESVEDAADTVGEAARDLEEAADEVEHAGGNTAELLAAIRAIGDRLERLEQRLGVPHEQAPTGARHAEVEQTGTQDVPISDDHPG